MSWFSWAILAYFILAFESVANKFLISGKVKSWRLYLFYMSLLSVFGFFLIFFGGTWIGPKLLALALWAGWLFWVYLAFLFSALKKSAASRVFVLAGAVSTFLTMIFSRIFELEELGGGQVLGIILLLLGGFLTSYKFYKKKFFGSFGRVILAGVFYALSAVFLKMLYNQVGFVNGYSYSRLGIVLGTVLALAVPSFRAKIFGLLKSERHKKKTADFGWITGTKILAGIATVILNYSLAHGNISIVNALISVQYVFVFLFSLILVWFLRKEWEHFSLDNILLKALGAGLVAGGVWLVIV